MVCQSAQLTRVLCISINYLIRRENMHSPEPNKYIYVSNDSKDMWCISHRFIYLVSIDIKTDMSYCMGQILSLLFFFFQSQTEYSFISCIQLAYVFAKTQKFLLHPCISIVLLFVFCFVYFLSRMTTRHPCGAWTQHHRFTRRTFLSFGGLRMICHYIHISSAINVQLPKSLFIWQSTIIYNKPR